MAINKIEVDVSDKFKEIFTSTKIRHCRALSCRFNDYGKCNFQLVYLSSAGECELFEPKEEDDR